MRTLSQADQAAGSVSELPEASPLPASGLRCLKWCDTKAEAFPMNKPQLCANGECEGCAFCGEAEGGAAEAAAQEVAQQGQQARALPILHLLPRAL